MSANIFSEKVLARRFALTYDYPMPNNTGAGEMEAATIQQKVQDMQQAGSRNGFGSAEIIQNDNGTFSHRYDSQRQWGEKAACALDLKFTKEAHRGRQNV